MRKNDVRLSPTDSEVEQADPYASGKQHGEVGRVREFRFFIRFSQFHLAVFGKVQGDNKHGPGVLGPNVHPSEGASDPHLPFCHLLIRDFRFAYTPNYKAPDNNRRHEGHNWIQANVDTKARAAHFAPFPVYSEPSASVQGIFLVAAFATRIHITCRLVKILISIVVCL